MRTARRRRLSGWVPACAVVSLLTIIALGALSAAATVGPAASSARKATSKRVDVMLVGNNHGGTVTILDARSFKKRGEIDVAPDYDGCLSGPPTPDQSVA